MLNFGTYGLVVTCEISPPTSLYIFYLTSQYTFKGKASYLQLTGARAHTHMFFLFLSLSLNVLSQI